jgi:hypothetical protein
MSDGAGPPASVLLRVGFFLVAGAILFVLFERFGPYQPGRGYHPRPIETVSAAGAVLDRTIDGHFYLSGRINDTSVAFLVDTGASTIAIGETLAAQLDLGACRSRRYSTAAGTGDRLRGLGQAGRGRRTAPCRRAGCGAARRGQRPAGDERAEALQDRAARPADAADAR